MKIQEFNLDWFNKLKEAWVRLAPKREDAARSLDALQFFVLDDGGTQWYQVPNHEAWFYIRSIIPGLSAEFYFITLESMLERRDVKRTLQSAMREYDLRRLNLTLPAPINPKFYQSLGFVQEGRLRDATIYDGKYTDLVVFGFHRSEVEKSGLALTKVAQVEKKSRKRKRRSRRRKLEGARQEIAPEA